MINQLLKSSKAYMTLSRTNILILDLTTGETNGFNHFSMPKFIENQLMKNISLVSRKHDVKDGSQTILYKDQLKMCYLIMIFTEKSAKKYAVSLGPFLDRRIQHEEIKYLGHSMKLTSENIVILRNYYSKLPQYDIKQIHDISSLSVSIFNNKIPDTHLIIDTERTNLPKENKYSSKFEQYDFVEQNYKRENEIMECIETGDTDRVSRLINLSYEQVNVPARSKYNPLRDIKNLTITLNSVSTRAAIRGGLNVHLAHSISTKYAVAIESQETIEGVLKLTPKLVYEFCKSVRDYSLQKYSPLIKKTLIYIRKNISSSISLEDIASKLHTSKEHLSRAFKKEMNMNITDYIHEIKVKESLDLIKSNKFSISDIAFMFGYSSSAYFSSVFKKVMGVSPKHYKK